MATRRPRTNSRLTTKSNQQVVAEREEDIAERMVKPKKRKLSDMLGPPWSKEDLQNFYLCYRKFGKDWKKVAGCMKKRTKEMVAALYGMNRAYLSLPDGAASAEGLIAMMTDHYNILDGSDEESSQEFGTSDPSHQTQSRLRTRTANVSNTNSGVSGYGGPSPAKKPRSAAGTRSRVVGKRTPRYPVGNVVEQKGKSKVVVNKMLLEETTDEDNDESKEAEVVAMTLVAALQRAPSPLVSKVAPTRRSNRALSQNGHGREYSVKVESGGSGPKHTGSTSGDVGAEGSQESKERPGKASSSATVDETDLHDRVRQQTSDGKSRWKKPPAKKPKMQKLVVKYDEPNEQCSQTGMQEEDTREDDDEKNVSGQRKKCHSSQRTKKRSRQLFSGENCALDALVKLADLCLLRSPTRQSVSEEREEEKPQRSESNAQVVKGSTEKSNKEVEKRDGQKKEDDKTKEKSDKEETRVFSALRQQSTSPLDSRKRKRKSVLEKLVPHGKLVAEEQCHAKTELHLQVLPPKAETPVVLKPRRKPKRVASAKTSSKQGPKVNKAIEASGVDVEVPVHGGVLITDVDGRSSPLKVRSKRKGIPEKGPVNGFVDVGDLQSCPHTTTDLGPLNMKARLIHCLSPKVRRWCMYEWFYSAIDLPWFARNEFVEYLNHAGLGHVPRLTRVEWGVIRSSLGKPRRLSKSFLQEERIKLERYREEVRTHYNELRGGLREGLPSDLARPLTVGQRVIARHPKTRQIHDGSILTVDRSRCRVQFDRPELGVEFVMDIDAMPIHPLENMPEVMRRKRIILDAMDCTLEDSKLDVKSRMAASGGVAARTTLNERLERSGSVLGMVAFSQIFLSTLTKSAQVNTLESVRLARSATSESIAGIQQALITQPYTAGQALTREADIQALVELTGSLNRKEALIMELRRVNDDMISFKGSEVFQRKSSSVTLQLKEVNDQIFDALKHLRHRNKLQDNSIPAWHHAVSQTVTVAGGTCPSEASLLSSLEAAPAVVDMTSSSKKHARTMVLVAVQTISTLKDGEEPLPKIAEALEQLTRTAPSVLVGNVLANVSGTHGLPLASTAASSLSTSQVSVVDSNGEGGKSRGDGGGVRSLPGDGPGVENATLELVNHSFRGESRETMVLSELMASCVATLLMVQSLSERQFPAPEVVLTLDTALESLRPQAVSNQDLFKDIEQQLSYIKTQILSQIPIQSTIPCSVETTILQPNPTSL